MNYKIFFILLFISFRLIAQKNSFTKQDTLRGSITPERVWWDLKHYDLSIQVFPNTKAIKGKNTITYTVLKSSEILQIDLQPPLTITKVTQTNKALKVTSQGNAHFIHLLKNQNIGEINTLEIYYEGKPKEAINAPWDGGFSWKKDSNGKPFIATSCQGLGASIWWPNKDHMYDEVEHMDIRVRVPSSLMGISNGRLEKIEKHKDTTTTYHWTVKNPINNYGVNINIGDYTHFSEKYNGEGGLLDMEYYVLTYNVKKAKQQFKDAPKMMKAFEHWFGKYPFYEDSYKLVEVPYLGMEHQSSVTYGNNFKNGYLGEDLSGTGWGLKFDFIIIHESGHEWFANNITYKDMADMWIHESFTAYSESLFLEYYYGKKAATEYLIGTRKMIQNDTPIIGSYNVNDAGSSDMYYKGANMLHTIRQLIHDDEKWRQILRGLNSTFYHKTVTTKEIETYISKEAGIDLTSVFNQYLRDVRIPILEYSLKNKQLKYQWAGVVPNFNMSIDVLIDGKQQQITPSGNWKTKIVTTVNPTFQVAPNFYIHTQKNEL